jgi:hypothetical protein
LNKITCLLFLIIVIISVLLKYSDIEINKFFTIIFIFGVILILLYTVNEFINGVIKNIKLTSTDLEEINEEENNNAQKIGFIERILYFIGIVSQNWTLISIVIVFKTIARYKEIDVKIKAEYFLVGSLLSLLSTIIIAVIFIVFDNIHNFGIVKYILSLVTYNLKIIN